MTWVKIDDRFTEHRKLLSFTRAERWTWLELLCYCGRHDSPHVPADIDEVLRYVTSRLVDRWVEVGLLDPNPDGSFEVHDWRIYNAGTLEDRVAAYLETSPEATANEVHRAVGGKRSLVLALVSQAQQASETPVPGVPLERFPERYPSGSPRARARTRPDPTPRGITQQHEARGTTRPDPGDDDAPLARLAAAGWNRRQLTRIDRPDLPRAIAWLDHAERSGARNPGALAWSGYDANAWPPDARPDIAPGAQGPRSTTTVHPHVCAHCGLSYKTEQRLDEHLELIHDDTRRNGNDEPIVDLDT